MPSLVTRGDRIVTLSGRESWLARPSTPFSAWSGGSVQLLAEGRSVSYSQLYRTQPWVKVCVDKLAHQIATLPLKVYKDGSDNEKVRVKDGPLVALLERPWHRARPVHLQQKMAFPLLLHGNSLFGKVRENGLGSTPIGLTPLDWRYVAAQLDSDQRDLMAWQYESPTDGTVYISPDETVYFYWESPDGVTGTSPLQPLGVTIAAEDAAQTYSASNFQGGVTPGMAITLPDGARYDDETRRGIREEVERDHGGQAKSGGVMVIGGGATVDTLSHTAKEAELIEQRKLNREEVAAVYDIPPPMIGILDKATYSNISEQHKMLYMTVLRPYLTMMEETIQAHLMDGERAFEGYDLEFDLAEVLKGDAKDRADAFKVFLEAGVYTINELRALENLHRIDNPLADRPLIPANNMQPLDSLDDKPKDPTGIAPVLASHIDRVAKRVLRGNDLNAVRFKSELAEDLDGRLGASAEPFAGVWAAAVEQGVTDADGDQAKVEQFFQSLQAA